MNLSTLRALQKRIRECKGPDRELDCLIACALLGGEPDVVVTHLDPEYRRRKVGRAYFDVPNFTNDPDLGACVALIEAALPEANCIGFDRTSQSALAYVSRNHLKDGHWLHEAERADRNICLALLESAIAAKIAELEAEQEKETSDVFR